MTIGILYSRPTNLPEPNFRSFSERAKYNVSESINCVTCKNKAPSSNKEKTFTVNKNQGVYFVPAPNTHWFNSDSRTEVRPNARPAPVKLTGSAYAPCIKNDEFTRIEKLNRFGSYYFAQAVEYTTPAAGYKRAKFTPPAEDDMSQTSMILRSKMRSGGHTIANKINNFEGIQPLPRQYQRAITKAVDAKPDDKFDDADSAIGSAPYSRANSRESLDNRSENASSGKHSGDESSGHYSEKEASDEFAINVTKEALLRSRQQTSVKMLWVKDAPVMQSLNSQPEEKEYNFGTMSFSELKSYPLVKKALEDMKIKFANKKALEKKQEEQKIQPPAVYTVSREDEVAYWKKIDAQRAAQKAMPKISDEERKTQENNVIVPVKKNKRVQLPEAVAGFSGKYYRSVPLREINQPEY